MGPFVFSSSFPWWTPRGRAHEGRRHRVKDPDAQKKVPPSGPKPPSQMSTQPRGRYCCPYRGVPHLEAKGVGSVGLVAHLLELLAVRPLTSSSLIPRTPPFLGTSGWLAVGDPQQGVGESPPKGRRPQATARKILFLLRLNPFFSVGMIFASWTLPLLWGVWIFSHGVWTGGRKVLKLVFCPCCRLVRIVFLLSVTLWSFSPCAPER
ncbi:hypothetical protein GWK47_054913 [Chionoecetes opilio]|uniref:Uncharacterized protein n=1 Tax=Chionoecetes opilio TaxID=41210 RepID=A0A8J4XZL6_CHIOP|nr:hypothetical protein GWK47_054913 [Chionoecetes opilio]